MSSGFFTLCLCAVFASGHSTEIGFRKFSGPSVPLVTNVIAFKAYVFVVTTSYPAGPSIRVACPIGLFLAKMEVEPPHSMFFLGFDYGVSSYVVMRHPPHRGCPRKETVVQYRVSPKTLSMKGKKNSKHLVSEEKKYQLILRWAFLLVTLSSLSLFVLSCLAPGTLPILKVTKGK